MLLSVQLLWLALTDNEIDEIAKEINEKKILRGEFFIWEFIISLFVLEIWLESENQTVPPMLQVNSNTSH